MLNWLIAASKLRHVALLKMHVILCILKYIIYAVYSSEWTLLMPEYYTYIGSYCLNAPEVCPGSNMPPAEVIRNNNYLKNGDILTDPGSFVVDAINSSCQKAHGELREKTRGKLKDDLKETLTKTRGMKTMGSETRAPNPRVESNEVDSLSAKLTPEEMKLLAELRRQKQIILAEIQQLKAEINEVSSEMEAVEQPDEGNNEKQIAIGRKKFNMDPKKGIEYLTTNELLNDTPEDIAKFLLEEDGLNKTMIGDYLGENKEPMLSVLQNFVDLQNFRNLLLVDALRTFLWSFRLPGEAQKIDRMMECFAKKYCDQNEGVFTSTDTCYVLSFSIIMLNTSLHNPSVKDKPTVDKFITMNRGINCGGDLPKDLLVSLYENIKKEPFKVPEDDGSDITRTFFNPDNEGYLTKEGGHHKNWKKRYFILKDNCLYYFKEIKDKEPRGIIPLENLQVREITNEKKPFCFEISASEESGGMIKACKTDSEGKVVEGRHESYKISCETEKERTKWMKCIKASMVMDPFYDFLQARKKKATQKTVPN